MNWHGQGTPTGIAPLPEERFVRLRVRTSAIPDTLDGGSADSEQSAAPPDSAPSQEISGLEPGEIIDCGEYDDFDDDEKDLPDNDARPGVNVYAESPAVGDDRSLLVGTDQAHSDLGRTYWNTPDEMNANTNALDGRRFSTGP
jgi:hypothetical protein